MKLKRPNIKFTRGKQLVLLAAILIILGVVWASVSNSANKRIVQSVVISYYNRQEPIMQETALLKRLYKQYGTMVGRPANEINISGLEASLHGVGAIQKVQVYVELDGILRIKVLYRKPVIRVKNKKGKEFYMDSSGYKFLLNDLKPQYVILANGFISEPALEGKAQTLAAKDLCILGTFLSKHPTWQADCEQCYVDKKSELTLIPRVGKHTIELGDTKFIEEKFQNLHAFYTNGLNKMGWNNYTKVIIKYRNQVLAKPAVLNSRQNK